MMNSAAIKGQKERKIPVMEKIASFTIDHIKLKPGVYVSRKDHVGDSVITTFDLRMTSPNVDAWFKFDMVDRKACNFFHDWYLDRKSVV